MSHARSPVVQNIYHAAAHVLSAMPPPPGLPIWTIQGDTYLEGLVEELNRSQDVLDLLTRVRTTASGCIAVHTGQNGYRKLVLKTRASLYQHLQEIGLEEDHLDIGVYGGLLTRPADSSDNHAYQMDVHTQNLRTLCLDCFDLAGQDANYDQQRLYAKQLGSAHLVNHRCINYDAVFKERAFDGCRLRLMVLSIHREIFDRLSDGQEITVWYGPEYVKTRQEWYVLYVQDNPNAGRKSALDRKLKAYDASNLRECSCEDCVNSGIPSGDLRRNCMQKFENPV